MEAPKTVKKNWYRLDNSAKIYPAVMSRNWASMFRVSLTLKEPVDPAVLQAALEDTVRRIPTFCLSLHRGLFWYYLNASRQRPLVEPDVANPCKKMEKGENGGYCFRLRYYRCRIAVELFHSIADGTGAMIFLKTLAGRYLQLRGYDVVPDGEMLDCSQEPTEDEMEDSHSKYAQFRHIESRREEKAYHPRMTREPAPTLHVITGLLPVAQVHERAKALGATINEYLAGALCYAFYIRQKQERNHREYPVKISVPINMRAFYPSKTVRNFALFVNPGVDPAYGEYSFEEIVQHIHHFMRLRLNEKYLNAVLSANVGSEKNAVSRAVPLFIKNFVMSMAYRLYGESRYSISFSNLGLTRVPPSMEPYVERFDFMMGAQRFNSHGACAVSYGDTLAINITSTVEETDIERLFFTELVKRGIHVRIESNRD